MIFDEISSGFRLSIGGLYKLHDLEPDIVVLGKALGNGFGISAVLGKREIMKNHSVLSLVVVIGLKELAMQHLLKL